MRRVKALKEIENIMKRGGEKRSVQREREK